MTLVRHDFPSTDALAEALAQRVAQELGQAVDARGAASLAVSGGKTPVRFLRALSKQPLDWEKVVVTLVDERLVPDSDERSNARLVRQNLLQGDAAAARFVPLHGPGTAEKAARRANDAIAALPRPLNVVVLGMGTDGHSASFFPDAEDLPGLLENREGRLVLPVSAQSAGEPRLTLSLQLLAAAGLVVLHIEGADKRRVLEDALEKGDRPVSAFFRQTPKPIEIYWAP